MLAERDVNVTPSERKKVTFKSLDNATNDTSTPTTKLFLDKIMTPGKKKPQKLEVDVDPVESGPLFVSDKATAKQDVFGFPQTCNLENGCEEFPLNTQAWNSYIEKNGLDWLGARSKELEMLVMKHSIPKKNRPAVWMKWSGAEELRSEHEPSYYETLKLTAPEEKVSKQIELDLPRTCPQHADFGEINSMGVLKLRNVLYAYAVRNKELGYLQSMNFIAAQLLLVTDNEEQTFWILTAVVERMLGEGFYLGGLGSLLKSIDTFAALVAEKLPQVSQKLNRVGLNISFRVPNWFLCMFFNSLKPEVVTRVWDLFFFHAENTTAALCCVGLALVDISTKGILESNHAPGCAKTLQTTIDAVVHANEFLRVAFHGKWTVLQIRRAMKSESITQAVQQVRDNVVAPRTTRKHKRSRSAGDAEVIFSEFQSSNDASRRRGAQTGVKPKRRRVGNTRSFDDSNVNKVLGFSTPHKNDLKSVESSLMSPFVAFKRWLTPSKYHGSSSVSTARKQSTPVPGITFHSHKFVDHKCGSPMGMELQPRAKSRREASKQEPI
jgi:TBC1 domain family member 6